MNLSVACKAVTTRSEEFRPQGSHGKISKEVLNLIPRNIAEQHMLIPFAREGDILKIAMAEPQEEEVRAAIAVLTNLDVESYITSDEEILKAINNNY